MDVEEQTTENHENEAAVSPVTTATRANEVHNETVASMEVDSVAAETSEVAAEVPTTSGNAEQQQQNDQHDNEMVDAMSAMPMPVSSPLQPVANDDQNPEIEEPVREQNFELAAENLEAEVETEEEPPYSPEPYPMADAMGYDTDNSDGGGENVPELGNELDVPYENAQGNVEMAEAVNVEAGGEAVNDPTWHASRPYVRGALRTLIRQTRQDGQDFQNRHGSRRERPHNGVPGDVSTDDDDSSGSGSEDAEGSSHVEHDINISFDTNLPAEHSYLGSNMERVSGVNYIEASQHYRLMLFKHEHILFPGEILPFMLSGSVIENEIDVQNGLLFGVCFPFLRKKEEEEKLYGVTCQIYEKGRDELGKSVFKSRALQRFVTKASYLKGPLQFIAHSTIRCYGDVKILPEIYLPEPYKLMNMGSLKRFLGLPSMEYKLKRMHAAASPLPQHFYEKYNINHVVEKARAVFAAQKLDTMPSDPVQQSFWLVRNLHLSEELTNLIFTLDSVNKRMEVIGNSFEKDAVFVCRFCSKKIAHCRELFAMSKHGVQTQYCNSAGYIHETNTVYNVCRNAILYTGEPSSEFSWFPSYQWQIIICKLCSHHIGWKYSTDEPNLEPKTFFGITSTSVRITTAYTEPPPRDDFYRMLLQQIVPNSTP